MGQDEVFKAFEGDNYFNRNKMDLKQKNLKNDIVLKMINLFNIAPKKVLELGCANGYRLNYLQKNLKCQCYGVDCSKMAIADGQKRYKGVKLSCSGVENLIFKNGFFDLVIINFLLHWVERKILPCIISEADRVLKNKGLLIIGDFFPLSPVKKGYHHLKNGMVYTYKDDYSGMFEGLGYYQNIGRISAECNSKRILAEVEYDVRLKTDLLKKDLELEKCKK